MSIIHYRYNVGDIVKFKVRFHPSASCGLKERAGTTAKIAGRALPYNDRPHYYLEGEEAIFPETCFAGLAAEPVNSVCREEAAGANTLQGHMPSCDTRDSEEPENELKWNEAKWVEALFQRGEYHCSKCGGFALHKSDGTENPTSFCPHCGKKMINWEEV